MVVDDNQLWSSDMWLDVKTVAPLIYFIAFILGHNKKVPTREKNGKGRKSEEKTLGLFYDSRFTSRDELLLVTWQDNHKQ